MKKSFLNKTLYFRFVLVLFMAVGLMQIVPGIAFGYGGESHKHAAWEGTRLFAPYARFLVSPDERLIMRSPKYPLLPELEVESNFYDCGCEGSGSYDGCDQNVHDDGTHPIVSSPNDMWIFYGSKREDDYDSEYTWAEAWQRTLAHFWELDDGVLHATGSAHYNAWMKAEEMWAHSIDAWDAGDLGKAYFYLGKVLHLVVDMGQPAHPHGDLHANFDSLEQWASKMDTDKFSWYLPDTIRPGEVIYAKLSEDIYQDMLAHWSDVFQGEGESFCHTCDYTGNEFCDELAQQYPRHNVHPLFYLMSYVNQTADFCPSDGDEITGSFVGDRLDYLNWVNFDLLDQSLPDRDLSDNESGCDPGDGRDHSDPICHNEMCNADLDLWDILKTGYGTAFRAVPGVIDAWRRTLDSRAPKSVVDITRTDYEPYLEDGWNNCPLSVRMTDATDEGGRFRASGVWKVYGELDGVPATEDPANPAWYPSWGVATDGIHTLACMSVDMMGNVENRDITIKIDMTPPDVTFTSLRPNYLTSEDMEVSWEATDAFSGVASEVAYLDGTVIVKGSVVDLSTFAGKHTLEVYAYDVAGNYRYAEYPFEVWIDARAESQSTKVNNKTSGETLSVDIQFPAPYNVSTIDLGTTRLSVGGSIELTSVFPIIEIIDPSARLSGYHLTGVGDHIPDGIPDRSARFDKEDFADALGDNTGNISSIVWGSLTTAGNPRYIATVVTPVF